MTKTDIDKKLININKKNHSNKTKHIEAEKKLTDLTKKIAKISEKGFDFLLGRMYFIGDDGYQNFLGFVPMLSADTGLKPTMFNLANDRVNLKSNNSVLVKKCFSSLYSNFILKLYIVYELYT